MKRAYITITGFLVSHLPLSEKLRDLILWPISSRALGTSYTAIVRLKNGLRMRADLKDILNRFLLFYGPHKDGIWEPGTMHVLAGLIDAETRGDVVIAGSHIGYTSLLMSQRLSGTRKIWSFEPVAYLYVRSRENIALNGLSSKISLERLALSNAEGSSTVYVEDIRSSLVAYSEAHKEHHMLEKVRMATIDGYARKNSIEWIGLIFLDIEGYEYYALQGAEQSLKAWKPYVIFEISQKILASMPFTSEKVFAYLRGLGYSLYVIDDNYDSSRARRKGDGASAGDAPLVELDHYLKSPHAGLYYNVLACPHQDDAARINARR